MPWTTHIATTNKLHPDNKNIILGHMHNPSISCVACIPALALVFVRCTWWINWCTGSGISGSIMLYGCVYYFGTNYSLSIIIYLWCSVPILGITIVQHIGIKLSFISKTRTWYTNIFAINNIWYIKWSGLFICQSPFFYVRHICRDKYILKFAFWCFSGISQWKWAASKFQ